MSIQKDAEDLLSYMEDAKSLLEGMNTKLDELNAVLNGLPVPDLDRMSWFDGELHGGDTKELSIEDMENLKL